MRAALKLLAAGATTVLVGIAVLPLFVVTMVAGHLRQASLLASQWDIPAELVPVFQEAGRSVGVPWLLLAAVASVATDFGRHAPDGTLRGDGPNTSIFPVMTPPIVGSRGGLGMFLVDPSPAGGGLADPQDDRAAVDWLARVLAVPAAAAGAPVGPDPARQALAEPETQHFWIAVLAVAPLRIAAVAPSGGGGNAPTVPAGGGANPIRQFGAGLLNRIAAPVSGGNLDAIGAWAAGEGSCAGFNPLDTTQPEPGAIAFNTLPGGGHVWNYVSFQQGVDATASTLLNGLYQPVVAALRADAGAAAVERAVRQSPWGTAAFGPPAYAGRRCASGSPLPAPATASAPAAPPPPSTADLASVAATIVARAARYQAVWSDGPAASASVGDGRYVLPVEPSWFRAHPEWLQRPHHDFPAIDIAVPEATTVLAVTAGQVVASDEASGTTSCGHDVRLRGGDGVVYTYCHGSQVLVAVGQPVAAGQPVMRSGWSGNVVPSGPAGAHLHFQIDIPGRPGPVCPQPALTAWAAGQPYDPRQLTSNGCVAGHLP